MYNKLYLGNCIDVLQAFPENSIDCIVTDPPYGLAFMGKEWDKALPNIETFRQMFRVLKPGALAFIMSSPRQDVLWRMLRMLEECEFELRQSFISWIYKTGFPKAMDVAKGIDKKFKVKRKSIGTKIIDKGMQSGSMHSGRGIDRVEVKDEVATSTLAKKWDGWKSITGLKPALECILMVNKPMSESTIVDNVLRWGTGAMNVDACRIPTSAEDVVQDRTMKRSHKPNQEGWGMNVNQEQENVQVVNMKKGRFPANLLISDQALACFKYFDLDKWAEHHGFFDVPKPNRNEREKGLDELNYHKVEGKKGNKYLGVDSAGIRKDKIKNFHPTVKPIKLMSYLIELGCSKEGIVLDPFVGSGTTCLAAQKLNRKWIGIELNEEYANIAAARLGNVEIVREFKLAKVNKEIKKVSKKISKSNRPRCGYEGNCDYRDGEGYCMMRGKCNSKVI